MKTIFIFLMFLSMQALRLEIDEKLTTRIVNTSESKKTILINRGIEDGLAIGDHAKFYVSTGVVARGVVIKTSPTRSVWSLYRLVNNEFIREEQVLKLKITPAVKITKDESKMLVTDDTTIDTPSDPRDLGIPLAEGADDLALPTGGGDKILRDFESASVITSLASYNREVFGVGSYSSYTQKITPDNDGQEEMSRSVTNTYFKLGGEWYFKDEQAWYSSLSLLAHFALFQQSAHIHEGTQATESGSEFGFGFNLHLLRKPSEVLKFIPYFNYTMAFGSMNTTSYDDSTKTEDALDASLIANNFGAGFKFYTQDRLGMRFELSYRMEGNQYADDANGVSYVRSSAGPRILMGFSYRL